MQHVGLQREAEDGRILATFGPDGIDTRLVSRASRSGACLRFIDPYGDTVFNQLQLPELIDELNEMQKCITDDQELRDNINTLTMFLLESNAPHTYVRFIGD